MTDTGTQEATYELWTSKTDKAQGVYASLSEAVAVLRDLLAREGQSALRGLRLVWVRPDGSRLVIARDEDLLTKVLARHVVAPEANLHLHENTWSLLHYLAAVEERSKADLVEDALRDYAAHHQDRLATYFEEVAQAAGLPVPKKITSGVRRVDGAAVGRKKQPSDG